MSDFQIGAQVRKVTGKKVSRLRNHGLVPATLYGPKADAINLQFDYRELDVTLRGAGGTNLIDIVVENGDTYPVLAREVQRDIIKGDILHVDFFAVDMDTKIRAEIPISFVGESPIVTAREGIMITGPNSLTVEMLPSRLMDRITVDVSVLAEMGATIAVKDLDLGEDVTVHNDPDEMIARVVQPSAARAEEALEELVEGEELLEGEEGELEGEEGEEGEEEE